MTTLSTLEDVQTRVENIILQYLPQIDSDYSELHEAMKYAIYNGGKRLRPALVYFTGSMFGAIHEMLDPIACAVEMVHCFSLVHDDLPAMDNSDYRRGKLSCHKMFGEDVAILAGDNLLTLSMEILSDSQNAPLSHSLRLQLLYMLCKATGAEGMVGGQIMDIKNVAHYNQAQLEKLHHLKTGALIKASILMGALCSPTPLTSDMQKNINQFADTLGLLYQVCDDILDVIADEALLGKPTGTDEKLGKVTYVNILGLEESKNYARKLCVQAIESLHQYDKREGLQTLTRYIYNRITT